MLELQNANTEDSVNIPTLQGEEKNTFDTQADSISLEITPIASSNSNTKFSNPFLAGAIPKLIFKNAITGLFSFNCCVTEYLELEIPNSVHFRLEFFQLYLQFEGTSEGQDEVYESIAKDFPSNPECVAILARRKLNLLKATHPDTLSENVKESLETFETALKVSLFSDSSTNLLAQSTTDVALWESYASYCKELIQDPINTEEVVIF